MFSALGLTEFWPTLSTVHIWRVVVLSLVFMYTMTWQVNLFDYDTLTFCLMKLVHLYNGSNTEIQFYIYIICVGEYRYNTKRINRKRHLFIVRKKILILYFTFQR